MPMPELPLDGATFVHQVTVVLLICGSEFCETIRLLAPLNCAT